MNMSIGTLAHEASILAMILSGMRLYIEKKRFIIKKKHK
jgi:hypothetical protein